MIPMLVLLNDLMTANRYQRARADHSRENTEDYVELIDTLIRETGEARVVDIADRLGISHVSVTKTVRRLQREGLVTTLPYRSIFLTDAGRHIAEESRTRHLLVLTFLQKLGVPLEIAENDAEGIEHHVSGATLRAMEQFIEDGHT